MTRLPFFPRMTAVAALLSASVFSVHASSLEATPARAWTYSHGPAATAVPAPSFLAEIVAFDSVNQQLWVAGVSGVDVLDAATGTFIDRISITGGSINSVAIKNGVAAFAIESTTRVNPGRVDLYNTTTRSLLSGTNSITVGALPDMLTFTPDGSKLLVANEATPSTYGTLTSAAGVFPRTYGPAAVDPVGSVSVIDMSSRSVVATANPNMAPRSGSNIRTNTGMDFEPEYIAVNASGTQAYVTLQEANAVGVLDINNGSFTQVIGLGAKDFSQAGNDIDPLNNSSISFGPANAKGLYMPDGIASYEANNQTYLVMANEGDFREDDADRSSASAAGLNTTGTLANLRVSNTDSSTGNLFAAGGRSFSIRDTNGNLIYDSGDILDKQAFAMGIYDDGRSRDKGVEPEGVEVLTIGGRTYAFVGLERTTSSAIGVFDITTPATSTFVTMLKGTGDISPEGLKGFESNGVSYLAYSNEVSNTTSLFRLTAEVPEPSTYGLMLMGLGLMAFVRRRKLG